MYNVPNEPIGLPAVEPINMTVALRLTEELCNAKWEKHTGGDHYILPIGNALCINAESVTRTVFTKVKIIRDKVTSPTPDVDAVLIPSLVAIERNRPATGLSSQTTSAVLNWTLNDRMNQPIWVASITGEGTALFPGHPLSKNSARPQVEGLLKDLFEKSFQEISTARAIQEFAASVQKRAWRERPLGLSRADKR